MNLTRKSFLKLTSVSVAGIVVAPKVAISSLVSTHHPVCIFSKCLQFLEYDNLGEVVATLGFDGADLTVRKGGHVLPENVNVDLPKAVKALHKSGVGVPMIVTGITDDDRNTENILAVAADLGITCYRMGHYRYDDQLNVFENLDNHKRKLEKLEKLNRKYQIRGGYQNHSGPNVRVGGPVWDLHYLFKDFNPEFIGIQYDIMHATAEGGYSWVLTLKTIAPWINSLAIKDFLWEKGEGGWKTKWVPLGEGMVDFKKYVNEIGPVLSAVPVSIHYEYGLGGAEHGKTVLSMGQEEIYRKLARDLHHFKNEVSMF